MARSGLLLGLGLAGLARLRRIKRPRISRASADPGVAQPTWKFVGGRQTESGLLLAWLKRQGDTEALTITR